MTRGFGSPWYRQFRPISMDWPRRGEARQYPFLVTVRPRNPGFINLRTDTTENALGSLGAPKRGIGWPKTSPARLWMMDPQKRLVDFVGVVSPGGEDSLLAVAKGYQTSFATRPMDDRATIRGGIAVLHALGRTKYNADNFRSQIVQSPKDDARLIKAAGKSNTLSQAANVMRQRVKAAGPGAMRAAWGARGMYILGNLKGLNIGRGVGTGVAALFGPIGMAVSAAMAVHGSVISANTAHALKTFQGWLRAGVKQAGGSASAARAAASSATAARTRGGSASSSGSSMRTYTESARATPAATNSMRTYAGPRKHKRKHRRDADDDVPDPETTAEPGKQASPVLWIVGAGAALVLVGVLALGGRRSSEQVIVERSTARAPREDLDRRASA